MAPVAVVPLVDEAHGENELACRPEDEQPHGHLRIVEEAVDKGAGIAQHGCHCHDGQGEDKGAHHHRQLPPHALDVEVPNVDVVGDELPEDDREVVAQPAVDEEQDAACQAAHPVYHGRHDFLGPLRHDPLHQHAGREEPLCQEAQSIYQPRGAHRLASSMW